jgi:hypothetical protein
MEDTVCELGLLDVHLADVVTSSTLFIACDVRRTFA